MSEPGKVIFLSGPQFLHLQNGDNMKCKLHPGPLERGFTQMKNTIAAQSKSSFLGATEQKQENQFLILLLMAKKNGANRECFEYGICWENKWGSRPRRIGSDLGSKTLEQQTGTRWRIILSLPDPSPKCHIAVKNPTRWWRCGKGYPLGPVI